MNRDFKGIWISKDIWLSKDLSLQEKLFLCEINSLDCEQGCFASNAHFSEFFELSKNRCTEVIKSLEKKGFITIKLIREGKRISKRILRVRPIRNVEYPYSENRDTPIRKVEYPYSENREGSNTNINNTKERETRALQFLKSNSPSRFETEFLMRFKSSIKDHKKFESDFNDTVDQEELPYKSNVLFARLGKYARNWVQNQIKYSINTNDHERQTDPRYGKAI